MLYKLDDEHEWKSLRKITLCVRIYFTVTMQLHAFYINYSSHIIHTAISHVPGCFGSDTLPHIYCYDVTHTSIGLYIYL